MADNPLHGVSAGLTAHAQRGMTLFVTFLGGKAECKRKREVAARGRQFGLLGLLDHKVCQFPHFLEMKV